MIVIVIIIIIIRQNLNTGMRVSGVHSASRHSAAFRELLSALLSFLFWIFSFSFYFVFLFFRFSFVLVFIIFFHICFSFR